MVTRPTLGLLIDQLVSGYAREIIRGVEEGASEVEADLIIFPGRVLGSPHPGEYQHNVIFDYIREGTVDALVMATGTQGSFLPLSEIQHFTRRFGRMPLVSIGVRLHGVASVVVENRSGVHEAIAHLTTTHGVRRIGFLRGPENNLDAIERLAAYREAIHQQGLEDDPAMILDGDFTISSGRREVSRHLEVHGRPRFQALLAANDDMAMGAIETLRQRGVTVPGEVAVVGFDNIAEGQFALPSLTTVDQELAEQGRTAARLAIGLCRGQAPGADVVLPTHLVLRTSCGCLPLPVRALTGDAVSGARGLRPGSPASPEEIAGRCLASDPRLETIGDDTRATLVRLATEVGTERFVLTLEHALNDWILRGAEIGLWQELLAALRNEAIDAYPDRVLEIGPCFEQALMLLGDMLRIEQGRKMAGLQSQLAELRRVLERLASVSSLDELMDDVAAILPRLDISTFLVVRYADAVRHRPTDVWRIPDRGETLLAYAAGRRIQLTPRRRLFSPAVSLLPPIAEIAGGPRPLVATPTFFREEQIGYIVFQPGRLDWATYEAFCAQLGSVLKGSLLIEELGRLATLVGSSRDAIFGVDLAGMITSWNRGAEAAFGYPASEVVGGPIFALLSAGAEEWDRQVWREARSGRSVSGVESVGRRKDGTTFPISFTLSPIESGGGTITGVAVTARDMTEQKEIQARFIQAQRLESLGTLATGIAHQFNNINMIIKGHLIALLETGVVPLTDEPLANEAMKGVDRLIEITKRLQGLSGPSTEARRTCRLDEIAHSVLSLYHRKLDESSTLVQLDLDAVPVAGMDPTRSAFVVTALIDNALDALVDRPVRRITVRTGHAADRVFLEIADTGCGIRGEDLPRLFSPFYTTKGEWAVPGSSQTKVRGVGLSLSVCRSAVAESGGRILAHSDPGVGSTFRVELPVAR